MILAHEREIWMKRIAKIAKAMRSANKEAGVQNRQTARKMEVLRSTFANRLLLPHQSPFFRTKRPGRIISLFHSLEQWEPAIACRRPFGQVLPHHTPAFSIRLILSTCIGLTCFAGQRLLQLPIPVLVAPQTGRLKSRKDQ